jgi:hypothetical protein
MNRLETIAIGFLGAQLIRPNLEGFRHDCLRKVSASVVKGVECRRDVVEFVVVKIGIDVCGHGG